MYILIDGKAPPAGDRWGRTDTIRTFAYFIATHLRPDSVITWWDFEGTDIHPTYESLRAIADLYFPNVVPSMPLTHYGYVNVSNTAFEIRQAVREYCSPDVKPQRHGITFTMKQMEGGWHSFSLNEQDEAQVSIPPWGTWFNNRRMGKSIAMQRMIDSGVFADRVLRFDFGKEFPVMMTKTPEQLDKHNRRMGGAPSPLFPQYETMLVEAAQRKPNFASELLWEQLERSAALTKTSGLFGASSKPPRYQTRSAPLISPNFHEAYSSPNLPDFLTAGRPIVGSRQALDGLVIDSIPKDFVDTKFPKLFKKVKK